MDSENGKSNRRLVYGVKDNRKHIVIKMIIQSTYVQNRDKMSKHPTRGVQKEIMEMKSMGLKEPVERHPLVGQGSLADHQLEGVEQVEQLLVEA